MHRCVLLALQLLFSLHCLGSGLPTVQRSGFFMVDTVQEYTVRYRTLRNLIILPMVINDTVHVNMILDTGCRTMVLFGKRFQRLLNVSSQRLIQFSGFGEGQPVVGRISLMNKISMQAIVGHDIPIVVVPNKNMFQTFTNIHGIIGYDILTRFEIELNPISQTITFRPADRTQAPAGYSMLPLNVLDCRPILSSKVFSDRKDGKDLNMMIDTGSAMGVLLRVKNLDESEYSMYESQPLQGLNGSVRSYQTIFSKVQFDDIEMRSVPTGIINSPWKNDASIGMGVLKDYIIILNYCKSYACFKKVS
jgi:hypothetical protein